MEEDSKSQRSSGTGKSHIALGLGLAAGQKGLSVGFIAAAALVHELIEAGDEKRLLRLQRHPEELDPDMLPPVGVQCLSEQDGKPFAFVERAIK